MNRTLSPAEVIEASIEEFSSGSLDQKKASKKIRRTLLQMAKIPEDSSLSFSAIFEDLATTTNLPSTDKFSTLTIRLISCKGLLPDTIGNSAGRHLVKLIEQGNKTISSILPKPGLLEVLSNLVFGGFAGWRHIWLFEFTTNRNRGVHRHDIECI